MLNVIKVYGIEMERNWFTFTFKMVNLFIEIMSIAIVSYSIYSTPKYQLNVFNVATIVLCILTRQVVCNNMATVIDVMQPLNSSLNMDKIEDVKRADSFLAILIGFCYIVGVIGGSVDALGYNSIQAIGIGLNIRPLCCPAILDLIVICGYMYHFHLMAVFVCLYCIVQYVFVKHAQACRILFTRHLQSRLNDTDLLSYLINCQDTYKLHLNAKRRVNELLGFIPFSFFSLTFIFLVVTTSYLIVNEESIPKSFIILCVLPAVVTSITIKLVMVRLASYATDEFEHARIEAGYIAISSISHKARLDSIQRETLSLYMLISVEKPVYATAWGMFDISRQILLQFTNAVIPFAVMIITASLNKSKV